MPSTFELKNHSKDPKSDNGSTDKSLPSSPASNSSSLKRNSMKVLGSKIKAETRKLIGYPGKAVKRPASSEESSSDVCSENDYGQVEDVDVEDFSCYFKEHDILMEFKYLCKNPPSGIYVVPSLKSLQVWHGIIFIRAGPYQEGVFRFDILLPDNFPNDAPIVRFSSAMFHPQIHKNGVINIEPAFPCWKKGENHISDVLKYIKSCFYSMSTWHAFNEEAASCINENLDRFKAEARRCVDESLCDFERESSVTSEDDGNLLKLRSFSPRMMSEWKEKLLLKDFSHPNQQRTNLPSNVVYDSLHKFYTSS